LSYGAALALPFSITSFFSEPTLLTIFQSMINWFYKKVQQNEFVIYSEQDNDNLKFHHAEQVGSSGIVSDLYSKGTQFESFF
jgi:hypothetical protein